MKVASAVKHSKGLTLLRILLAAAVGLTIVALAKAGMGLRAEVRLDVNRSSTVRSVVHVLRTESPFYLDRTFHDKMPDVLADPGDSSDSPDSNSHERNRQWQDGLWEDPYLVQYVRRIA